MRVSPKRFFQSVGYGFLNCKTYWLILLLCLRGMQVDLLALVLYACLPGFVHGVLYRVFARILPRYFLHHTFPSAIFYHYHRTVHLPGPYSEGHRHHHYLADATPFDAHMHGTGMPEEWFKLMTEISVCLLTGLMPWSFTWGAIKQSLENKLGHTRIEAEHPVLDNFHVGHHQKHFKNFGFAAFPLRSAFRNGARRRLGSRQPRETRSSVHEARRGRELRARDRADDESGARDGERGRDWVRD